MNAIYLDHNSTTPIHPSVAAEMADCLRHSLGNPASQHQFGRQARNMLEQARHCTAQRLGAEVKGMEADRLILTSGGTESNNLALLGFAGQPPGNVVVSAIEHPSVTGAARQLQSRGFEIRRLGVNSDGILEISQLTSLVDQQTRLVTLMLANNETGVLQPVQQAARICRQLNVPIHTDAVQAVGKIPVHFRELDVDALTFTGHKFHGPHGVGGLLIRHDRRIEPQLHGGFQQSGFRPGTEGVALAVGLCSALRLFHEEDSSRTERMRSLRDRLEERIRAARPEAVVVGAASQRVPHTTNLAFPGLDRQALLMALDLGGVACSTGSACASGSSEPSPVLLAMNCPPAVVEGSIRLSLGALTSVSEIDEAASRIIHIVNNLHA